MAFRGLIVGKGKQRGWTPTSVYGGLFSMTVAALGFVKTADTFFDSLCRVEATWGSGAAIGRRMASSWTSRFGGDR